MHVVAFLVEQKGESAVLICCTNKSCYMAGFIGTATFSEVIDGEWSNENSVSDPW